MYISPWPGSNVPNQAANSQARLQATDTGQGSAPGGHFPGVKKKGSAPRIITVFFHPRESGPYRTRLPLGSRVKVRGSPGAGSRDPPVGRGPYGRSTP